MAEVAHLYLVSAPAPAIKAPRSILDITFQPDLEKFNQLTRDLRAKGIAVVGNDFPENALVIEEEHADLLSRAFAHEIRGYRSKSIHGSRMARRTVTIRGVDVVWFTVLQEQGQ